MPSRAFPPNPSPNPRKILLLSLTISASALFLIGLLLFLYYLYNSLINQSRTTPFDTSPPSKLYKFSYRELKSATNAFTESNAIGKGGSGTVFRGILRDGKSVAIKKLDALSLQAEREFQNELHILGGLKSPFVVSLLGYCVEKKKRFLVYEYIPNRSLQEALFGEDPNSVILSWDQRFEIVLDVARGLSYLHLECDPPVIHGDIKPSNVLLGMDYKAKVSDFGLSRIKVEGEIGVDIFSQELGRSQELSGNLAAVVPTETPTESSEVNFALALQASSSYCSPCKNSIVEYNVKNLSSFNVNGSGFGVCEHVVNCKGKEVLRSDINGVDWNKFVPYDDELCSVEHSKELKLSDLSSPMDDSLGGAIQWGKDWWWRQDGSGELCSKDYVKEWISCQICPSRNPDWDEDSKCPPSNNLTRLDKPENFNDLQLEEPTLESGRKMPGKKELKSGKGSNKKHRKMQEWWKEEHLAEMSKKSSKLRKVKSKCKKGFKIPHFDLGHKFWIRKRNGCEEQDQNDPNVEFSFRKGLRKKKRNHSVGSDMWSGDLFSRELSSTTSMRGTVCYVAPEYGGCGYLMEKADIYSLGVLILVIVSGRRPLHVLSSPMNLEQANLVSWCRHLAQAGNVLELVDERVKNGYNKDQASLCINLALMCLQKMPELRPDISEIVKILKGEMDLPTLPFEFSPSPPSKLFSRSRRRAKPDLE